MHFNSIHSFLFVILIDFDSFNKQYIGTGLTLLAETQENYLFYLGDRSLRMSKKERVGVSTQIGNTNFINESTFHFLFPSYV